MCKHQCAVICDSVRASSGFCNQKTKIACHLSSSWSRKGENISDMNTILNPTICRDNWNVGPSPLERIGNRRCDQTNLVFWTIVILDNNSDWRKSASRQLWRTVVDTTSDTITLRERHMDWDEGGHKFWWEWTQILRDKENGRLDNRDGSASTAAPARTLSPRSKVIFTNGLQKLVPRKKKFSFV